MNPNTNLQRYLNYLGIDFSVATAIDMGTVFYELASSASPSAFALFRKGFAAIGWCCIAYGYFTVVRQGRKKADRPQE